MCVHALAAVGMQADSPDRNESYILGSVLCRMAPIPLASHVHLSQTS